MLSGVCLAVDNSFVAGVATSGTIFIYDVSVARARSVELNPSLFPLKIIK